MNWQDKAALREYHRARRAANSRYQPAFAMSHAQIGKIMGLTEQRVGQLERQALRKLRLAFELIGITDVLCFSTGGEQKLINHLYRNNSTPPSWWQETHYNSREERLHRRKTQ